ncbi:MAG: thiamine pyrophosphate-binding protein [Candidatus Dormibacteraeota bacterium]|nr:thiamine pyrophosphate-binding protein [Candidatus Dormibacteraeota bacterium]
MPDVLTERPRIAGVDSHPHGGQLLAAALKRNGVSTLFTLPGGHILLLLDACGDESIRVIDTRHEGAATLAAEGWALATGEVGAAAVTAGPGFANGLIGLLDAGCWSVPLLMLAGRTGTTRQGRGAVMDIDQRAIAAPGVKWAASCTQPGRIARDATEALQRARSGCPGAVYLDVPWDVMRAEPAPLDVVPDGVPDHVEPPAASPAAIGAAVAALQAAERPIILAGSGAFWSGAGDEIAQLAETASIPVITASAARGVIGDSHPWSLGSLVHGGLTIPNADCVLMLGSAFNANVMYGNAPLFGTEQTIIQVDTAPERIGGNRAPAIGIVGDVRSVVSDMRRAWRKDADSREDWLKQARGYVAASLQFWDQQVDTHDGAVLHPGAVTREIAAFARERFGGDVTFVADGGDALAWALAYFYTEKPGRMLTTTTSLGTLGVGMPFAIAAQAARPEEPVLLFVGDGSFGLTAMEIDTAVRHDLPVIVVVSNNAGWGDVRHEQDQFFGEGRRVASELQPTRYDRLGQALGARGEHVERFDELRPALQRAVDSKRCTVIDVTTDPAVLSELLKMVATVGLM